MWFIVTESVVLLQKRPSLSCNIQVYHKRKHVACGMWSLGHDETGLIWKLDRYSIVVVHVCLCVASFQQEFVQSLNPVLL